jgi:hypothetical protein
VAKDDLSPGGRAAIGIAMAALGLGILALAAYRLAAEPEHWATGEVAALPIGLVFATGGLLIAVPERYSLARSIMGALMVTGFALACDWVAFGPGERHFGGGLSAGIVSVPVRSDALGRIVFGVFGVIFDVIAALAWWHLPRRIDRSPS